MTKPQTMMCEAVALMLVVLAGCDAPNKLVAPIDDAATTTIVVTATLASTTLTLAVEGADGNPCEVVPQGYCCQLRETGDEVVFAFKTVGDQFLYVFNEDGVLRTSPPKPRPTADGAGVFLDFGLAGAVPGQGSTQIEWLDPKITVKTGTCGGGDDDEPR